MKNKALPLLPPKEQVLAVIKEAAMKCPIVTPEAATRIRMSSVLGKYIFKGE